MKQIKLHTEELGLIHVPILGVNYEVYAYCLFNVINI